MPLEKHLPNSPEALRFSLRRLLIAFTLIAICIGLISAAAAYRQRHENLRRDRLAQLAQVDKTTMASIVNEVESIRAKLGRPPHDQNELEKLRGSAMPVIHDEEQPTTIKYVRTGEDSFQLHFYLWYEGTDDWIYDSKSAAAGGYSIGINTCLV